MDDGPEFREDIIFQNEFYDSISYIYFEDQDYIMENDSDYRNNVIEHHELSDFINFENLIKMFKNLKI